MGDYGISVVIPAYNVEKYIAATIDSVLAQSYKPDEIIVIDDGSKDATGQIVQRYPQVRYIRQDNAGVSVARNTGVEAANFPWIAFLDGDDQWLPDKLAEQIELLKRNPNLVWVAGNYIFNDLRKNKKNLFVPERTAAAWVRDKDYIEFFPHYKDFGITSNVILRKDVCIEAGGFRKDMKRMEDTDLWLRIAYKNPNVGYLAKPSMLYNFFRENSAMYLKTKNPCQGFEFLLAVIKEQIDIAKKCDREKKAKIVIGRILKGMARTVCRNKNLYLNQMILDEFGWYINIKLYCYLKYYNIVFKLLKK